MIYRIQVEQRVFLSNWVLHRERKTPITWHLRRDHYGDIEEGALRGPGRIHPLADIMWRKGLKSPELSNKRLRFWFTESGWKRVGLRIVAQAEALGLCVKVIREKNPASSRVAYRDRDQVALLPRRDN